MATALQIQKKQKHFSITRINVTVQTLPGNVQIVVGRGLAPAGWCGLVQQFRREQAPALPGKRLYEESWAFFDIPQYPVNTNASTTSSIFTSYLYCIFG